MRIDNTIIYTDCQIKSKLLHFIGSFDVLQTNLGHIFASSQPIIPATLASCARIMSFKHFYQIRKIYLELLGRFGIDHISINAIPQNRKMLIFSKTPTFDYSLYAIPEGIILDTTISPTFYTKFEYYFWNDCYPRHHYRQIINYKEKKYGFSKGVVLVRRIKGSVFLYLFATKDDSEAFVYYVKAHKELFFQMGDHCLEKLLPIYEQYADHTIDDLLWFFGKKPLINKQFTPKIFVVGK